MVVLIGEVILFCIFADHICEVPGCRSVIVIDGNMKNARQVCSCKDVAELEFKGMDGGIAVGKHLYHIYQCFNLQTPIIIV